MAEPMDDKQTMALPKQMQDKDIEAHIMPDLSIKLNFDYFLTLSGILKQFQIVLGFICIGIMINVLSVRGFEFIYKVFIICSICLVLFTIGFHFACLLEWEADGRLIMARIGYIFNRLACIILNGISLLTLLSLIVQIASEDLPYYRYQMSWWGQVILTMVLGLINANLYARSAKQVLKSIALY